MKKRTGRVFSLMLAALWLAGSASLAAGEALEGAEGEFLSVPGIEEEFEGELFFDSEEEVGEPQLFSDSANLLGGAEEGNCACGCASEDPYEHDWYCAVFQEQVDADCTCMLQGEGVEVLEHMSECRAYKLALQKKCTCGAQGDVLEHYGSCEISAHLKEAAEAGQEWGVQTYAAASGTPISSGKNGWTIVDSYDRAYDSTYRQISYHTNTEVLPFNNAPAGSVDSFGDAIGWFVVKNNSASGHVGYRITNVAYQEGKSIDAVVTLAGFNPYVYSTADEAVKVMTSLGVHYKSFDVNQIAFRASGGDQALRVELVEHGTNTPVVGNYGFRIRGINYGQRYGICARNAVSGGNALTGKYALAANILFYEKYNTLGYDWDMINAPQSGNTGNSVYLEMTGVSSFQFFIGAPGDHANDHPGHRYNKTALERKRQAMLDHDPDGAVPLTVAWTGDAYGPKDPVIHKFVSKTGENERKTSVTLEHSTDSFYYDFELFVPYDEPSSALGCAFSSMWLQDVLPAGIDYDNGFRVVNALTGADCTGWFSISANQDVLTVSASEAALGAPGFYENTYRILVRAKMDPTETTPVRAGDSYTYTMENSGTLYVRHKNDARGEIAVPTGKAVTIYKGVISRDYQLHKYISVSGGEWKSAGTLENMGDTFRYKLAVHVPYNEYGGYAQQFDITDMLPPGLAVAEGAFYAGSEAGDVTQYFKMSVNGKNVTISALSAYLANQNFYGKNYSFIFYAKMVPGELTPSYSGENAVFTQKNQFRLAYRHKGDGVTSVLESDFASVSGSIKRAVPAAPVKKVDGRESVTYQNRDFRAGFTVTQEIPLCEKCWSLGKFAFEDVLEECFSFLSAKIYQNGTEQAVFNKNGEKQGLWRLALDGQKVSVSTEGGIPDSFYGSGLRLELTVGLKPDCSLDKYYVENENPEILESHIPNMATTVFGWNQGEPSMVTKNTGAVQVILMETVPKGSIIVKKTSETGLALEGAVYRITAKEDIFSPAGKLLMPSGTEAETVTTDGNGKAAAKDLYVGKYLVTEILPPPGYALNKTPCEVEIKNTGNGEPGTEKEIIFQNKKTLVYLKKVSEKAPGETEPRPLSDVTFLVWNKESTESKAEKYVTDKTGMARLEGLKPGTYCYREASAPEGYVKSDLVKEFRMEENGLVENAHGSVILVENSFIKAEFIKKDKATGAVVTGAGLQLRDEAGKVVEIWSSEATPHRINRLPEGTYILSELSAPEGYKKSEPVICKIKAVPEVQCYEMSDTKYVEIRLTKTLHAKEIVWAHGNPIFTFCVSGLDLDGKEHVWYDTVEFSEGADGKPEVSASVTFHVPAGQYRAEELNTARYTLESITNVTGGTVSGNSAVFDLRKNQNGSAVFTNKKETDRELTDTAFVRNTVI